MKKISVLIMILIISLTIIASIIWSQNQIVILIKDIALAGTVSLSLVKTINISFVFNKYQTIIKEDQIRNMIVDNQNESIKLIDKQTFEMVRNTYSPLASLFSHRDFSLAFPNDLFSELFILVDHEINRPEFRFSNSVVNSKFQDLINASIKFVEYLMDHTYDYGVGLKVTKRKLLINQGESRDVFESFMAEEEKLNKLMSVVLDEYRKLIDLFYKEYSPT